MYVKTFKTTQRILMRFYLIIDRVIQEEGL
jgi:hypothetical protein